MDVKTEALFKSTANVWSRQWCFSWFVTIPSRAWFLQRLFFRGHPHLLNSQLQKRHAIGASQQCSVKASARCLYKPRVKCSSFKLPRMSLCGGSRDIFLRMLMPQSRRSRLPRCKPLLFCDVQGRPHSLPEPSYRMYECARLSVCLHLSDISP